MNHSRVPYRTTTGWSCTLGTRTPSSSVANTSGQHMFDRSVTTSSLQSARLGGVGRERPEAGLEGERHSLRHRRVRSARLNHHATNPTTTPERKGMRTLRSESSPPASTEKACCARGPKEPRSVSKSLRRRSRIGSPQARYGLTASTLRSTRSILRSHGTAGRNYETWHLFELKSSLDDLERAPAPTQHPPPHTTPPKSGVQGHGQCGSRLVHRGRCSPRPRP